MVKTSTMILYVQSVLKAGYGINYKHPMYDQIVCDVLKRSQDVGESPWHAASVVTGLTCCCADCSNPKRCERFKNSSCCCDACVDGAIAALIDIRAQARQMYLVVERYAGKMTEPVHAELTGRLKRMLAEETTQVKGETK